MGPPLLGVVSGPPGSGTTTLSRLLREAIGCPVVSRDEIKEGLVLGLDEYVAIPGDEATYQALALFYVVITVLVDGGVSLLAEASFQHRLWEPGLTPLLGKARVRIVHCEVDAAVARDRLARRAKEEPRHVAAHGDPGLAEPFESFRQRFEAFEPPSLTVPSLRVRTADGYEPPIAEIADFLLS